MWWGDASGSWAIVSFPHQSPVQRDGRRNSRWSPETETTLIPERLRALVPGAMVIRVRLGPPSPWAVEAIEERRRLLVATGQSYPGGGFPGGESAVADQGDSAPNAIIVGIHRTVPLVVQLCFSTRIASPWPYHNGDSILLCAVPLELACVRGEVSGESTAASGHSVDAGNHPVEYR